MKRTPKTRDKEFSYRTGKEELNQLQFVILMSQVVTHHSVGNKDAKSTKRPSTIKKGLNLSRSNLFDLVQVLQLRSEVQMRFS